jgi:hypothetical protein
MVPAGRKRDIRRGRVTMGFIRRLREPSLKQGRLIPKRRKDMGVLSRYLGLSLNLNVWSLSGLL